MTIQDNSTVAGMHETPTDVAAIRVVLLTEHKVLVNYGPILRRLGVGLFDEVGDLTFLSQDASPLLARLPCPPVRLIRQSRRMDEQSFHITGASRDIIITTPQLRILDRFWPQRQAEHIAETLVTFKPTLLHAMSEHQGPLARNLSKILNIPYVISLLSMHRIDLGILHDENCRMILPCSLHFTRRLRRRRPELARRLRAVPIGTHVTEDTHIFSQQDVLPQIICRGPLEHGHGFTELLNATRRLFDKGHRYHLTLAGDGPAESEFRRYVKKLDINDYVHFVPPIEDMVPESDAQKAVLKQMDIFIQPWPEKIWHPVLLEALSVGTAVIATRHIIINDLIVNEETALTVVFHDEEALVNALDKLLSDRDYARSLGRRAQNYLRKHFLASRMITRLAKAYRYALREPVSQMND